MKKKLLVFILLIGLTFIVPVNNDYNTNAATTKAVTSKRTYTVKFNKNGATSGSVKSISAKYGKAYKVPTNTLKKKGYRFAGWTKKKNGTGTVFKKSFKNLTSKNKGVVTLYAKWIPNTYTVKFDGNGATGGSMVSLNRIKYGKSYKLPKNSFKKKGYTFVGWTTKKSGTGKVYTNAQNIVGLTSKNKGTVTLYAKWKLNTYTVKFNGNGATSGSIKSISAKYGKAYKIPANTFKRKGYTFEGWTTKKNGTGKVYKSSFKNLTLKNKGVVTFYAKWNDRYAQAIEKVKYLTADTPGDGEVYYSKQKCYEILTNNYKFSEEEANYALNNSNVDWNGKALSRAKYIIKNPFNKCFSFGCDVRSRKDIKEQLVKDKFSEEEINYALNNLNNVDWKKKANQLVDKIYNSGEPVTKTKSGIINMLTEEMFTNEEIEYVLGLINWKGEAVWEISYSVEWGRNINESVEGYKEYLLTLGYNEEEATYAINNTDWNHIALLKLIWVLDIPEYKGYTKEQYKEVLVNNYYVTVDEATYAITNFDWSQIKR